MGERTRTLLAAGLRALGPPLGPDYYERLDELLITADVGPAMAARLSGMVRKRAPRTAGEAREALVAAALEVMSKRSRELTLDPRPACILMYGVNGAGKTTTIAKLAHMLLTAGRSPLIVAADTYRAAGIEQMVAWAERAGVPSFAGSAGADPAAVVFDGIQQARRRDCDVVLVDTAGRLQTQRNLLQELAKIGRVATKALEGAFPLPPAGGQGEGAVPLRPAEGQGEGAFPLPPAEGQGEGAVPLPLAGEVAPAPKAPGRVRARVRAGEATLMSAHQTGPPAYESLLVLDAVLGLASVTQARAFNEAIPMTGLVLAKLDGTARGGSVITIESELGVPVKLAGVGEGMADLAPFDQVAFIRSLVED